MEITDLKVGDKVLLGRIIQLNHHFKIILL